MKSLSDFLDHPNSLSDQTKHKLKPSSKHAADATIYQKYSIINLEPAIFGIDEIVEEAPLLFVGKNSFKLVGPTQNLEEIIESFKMFKEINENEDHDYLIEDNVLGLVLTPHHFNDFVQNSSFMLSQRCFS